MRPYERKRVRDERFDHFDGSQESLISLGSNQCLVGVPIKIDCNEPLLGRLPMNGQLNLSVSAYVCLLMAEPFHTNATAPAQMS